MKIYLVGGAVRDQLLGYPVYERDWVVVGSTPEQLQALGYEPVGKDFPVFLHPETKEEYALARTERKTAPGYTGFQFYASADVTLEQDLLRRDLTINAIAQNNDGTLVDPFHGKADLDARILRHVSDAFCEDPVRILRVARFAARYHHLGFKIAEETMALMRNIVRSGEADALVAERVWKEMARALLERDPQVFITALRDCGALARIMPELNNLFGVPQRPEYHPEVDTGVHTLMALEQACLISEELAVRLATLLHDLGKAQTPKDLLPRHHGHEVRSLPLVKQFCQRLAVPKYERDLAVAVAEFHTHCHRVQDLTPAKLVDTLSALDAFRREQRFEQRPYPSRPYFLAAYHACRNIDVKQLIAKGYQGKELGDQVRLERIALVKTFKQEWSNH